MSGGGAKVSGFQGGWPKVSACVNGWGEGYRNLQKIVSSFMNNPLPMWVRVSSSVAGASSSATLVEEVPQKKML